jgi:hypothetical protein
VSSATPALKSALAINKPETDFKIGQYNYRWADLGIRISVERLEDDGPGEISVYYDNGGPAKLLHWGRTNLLATQSCTQLAKRLGENVELDWSTILTFVATLTFQEHRRGEPIVPIGKRPISTKIGYQLYPLLEKGQATTLYAPGGCAKSYLADYFAILIQLGYTGLNSDQFGLIPERANCLYLDWESTKEDHERRVWAIKQGLGIDSEECFFYRFCERPLASDIHAIQRLVSDNDIGFIIIDSQMAASGYGPDQAQQSSIFYNALRSLRRTSLTIDHVSKSDWASLGTESTGPYGSVVKYNRARSVFEIKKSQEAGDDFLELSLKHIKHNEGKLLKPIGIKMNFNHGLEDRLDSVTFKLCNVADNPELAKTMSLKDRLVNTLKHGKREVGELSEELGVSETVIRARLNDNKKTFKHYVEGWGLLA